MATSDLNGSYLTDIEECFFNHVNSICGICPLHRSGFLVLYSPIFDLLMDKRSVYFLNKRYSDVE